MEKIYGNIVDIFARRIYYGYISINAGKIIDIHEECDSVRKNCPYIAPGLIDSHVHIESSMLSPLQFAKMAVRYGNIASVCDPHEITNVLGKVGIEYMMNEADKANYKFYFALPSCIPATAFETNGGKFDAEDMTCFIDRSVALAEMMDYVGVVNNSKKVLDEINLFRSHNKPIDGHVPGLKGDSLKKYIDAGISTDHECSNTDEAIEKINLGMSIQIREGSSARNYNGLKNLFLIENGKYVNKLMLCMDDAHPDDIRERGYVSRFFKLAHADNISIFDIYKAALINPVKHYNLNVGMLRVGDCADFVILDDINEFSVHSTYIDGSCVFDSAESVVNECISSAISINNFIDRSFTASDFAVEVKTAAARVISIADGELLSDSIVWKHGIPVGQNLKSSVDEDIMKICIINRYNEAPLSLGYIKGTGMKSGAIASSVAHDSHNVVIIGASDEDMAVAANQIFSSKGGIVAVFNNEVEKLALPIAGLMTHDDFNVVADKYQNLIRFAHEKCGVGLLSPFMTMAFMSLLVIPKLKIGDKGLFDVERFSFVDLFV